MPVYRRVECVNGRDMLDSKPLEDGEKVIVRWPNGTASNHTVSVATPLEGGDSRRGKAKPLWSQAFVKLDHKGFLLKIALRDSGLELIRESDIP